MEFSHRLDLFGPEIFAALNDKKVALEAEGRRLFNLSVGTPDFAPADHIKQALIGSTACGTCPSCWTPCAATTSAALT